MQRRAKPILADRIEKPEDRAWKEWYDKLDPKEHEAYLAKLGLDKDDIEEWEEAEGFRAPSAGHGETEEASAKKIHPVQAKKNK